MPALHITPWSTWAEWTYLHDLARRGPPAAATPALATYRARHPAALPLAIESTFALQSLLGAPPSYAARLALALALVRLVNGLTDRLQPRAATAAARPVATLAAAAGLPAGWVALRHDAVHAELPSWAELAAAGREAVTWLAGRYWEPQAAAVRAAAGGGGRGGHPVPRPGGGGGVRRAPPSGRGL